MAFDSLAAVRNGNRLLPPLRPEQPLVVHRAESLLLPRMEPRQEVRGEGLMVAAELALPGKTVVREALEAGFLLNCTQEKVLRFLPPLIIERQHVDQLIAALRPILAALPLELKEEKKEVHA